MTSAERERKGSFSFGSVVCWFKLLWWGNVLHALAIFPDQVVWHWTTSTIRLEDPARFISVWWTGSGVISEWVKRTSYRKLQYNPLYLVDKPTRKHLWHLMTLMAKTRFPTFFRKSTHWLMGQSCVAQQDQEGRCANWIGTSQHLWTSPKLVWICLNSGYTVYPTAIWWWQKI